jgi:hypothetical protein
MKKFGTPIGAAPGSANEKVGLAGVGTPLGVRGGGGVGGVFALFGFLPFLGAAGWLTLLPAWAVPGLSVVGFCPLPGPELLIVVVGVVGCLVVLVPDVLCDGFGLPVVEVEVEVEVGVELGVDVDVEVVGAGVVVVTVAAGVVAVAGGHDSDTLVIGRFTGSGSELGGVPGATFWKVKVWPPATVIVTVHPSADALGSAARPSTVTIEATVTAAILSFRVFNTVAYSSRRMPLAYSSELRSQVGLKSTLLAAGEVCNWEPSVWSMSDGVPTS